MYATEQTSDWFEISTTATSTNIFMVQPYYSTVVIAGNCGPASYAHLSPRARRLAEDNDAWAAALGMTVDEYLAMIGRHPTLPRAPRSAYRAGLRLRLRLAPRMDHLVHRMRARDPGRWLAGAGRRACGRRREPIDLS